VDNVYHFAQAPCPRSECRAGAWNKYANALENKKDGHRVVLPNGWAGVSFGCRSPSLCYNDGWGRMSLPPVAPSVAASKHRSARNETYFKGTITDVNDA
jgi:hypothetical protein